MPESAPDVRAPHGFRPHRLRLIVFDWDGTLADSTAIIADAIRAACADVGAEVPDRIAARYVIGLGLSDALRHVAPTLAPGRHSELSARFRHHYLARDAEIPLFEGARELLDDLDRAGYYLAVATGKTRIGLDRSLIHTRLTRRFHVPRCADEGRPKPHPDMLLHVLATTGVAAGDALMIGDTTHDLDLACNAGTHALAVTYGAHEKEGLASRNPLGTVHSIAELRQWLEQNG